MRRTIIRECGGRYRLQSFRYAAAYLVRGRGGGGARGRYRLVGRRPVGEEQSRETKYSHAGAQNAATVCRWSAMQYFVTCDQNVTTPEGPQHAMSIYGYDPASHALDFHGVSVAGGRAFGAPLKIDGDTWMYGGEAREDSKEVLRTLNVFAGPDSYTYRVEFSSDGGRHWTGMSSGTVTRVKK